MKDDAAAGLEAGVKGLRIGVPRELMELPLQAANIAAVAREPDAPGDFSVYDARGDLARAGSIAMAHHDLDALLQTRHITGGPGWLIDMLGLTRQRLETPADPDGSRSWQTADSHEGDARSHRH